MIKKLIILGLSGLLLITGCSKAEEPPQAQRLAEVSAPAPGLDKMKVGGEVGSKRYIATSHHLVLETTEAELPKIWESAIEFCRSIGCDIVSSSISKKTPYAPPSGSLMVRIGPQDVKRLFEYLGKAGNIVQQTTETEDKTSIVIDVEAKIKNLTGLRERLRSMLASRTGTLKDVVEVERELSRVQSELDSLATSRKVLANETEKVAVEIDFRSKQSIAETGAFAPIVTAWHESGRVFSQSIAAVITFLVAIVPWLFLIVPGLWFVPKLLRKLFKKRAERRKKAK
jgi:hypothetical protein